MAQIVVDIRLLDAVTWNTETECNFRLDDSVHIWRIHIAAYKDKVPQFLNLLQPDEIARANRYLQEKDRVRFIISRAGLRQIAGRYLGQPAKSIQFSTGPGKKPFVAGTNLQYNVSHSADWVLIAIAKTDVGADTETIDAAFRFQSILEDNFSRSEIDFIGNSPENFFLLWTRKESLTKATGQGLDDNLKHIPCLDGLKTADSGVLTTNKNWQVNSFKLDEKNWAAVVFENEAGDLRFYNGQL